MLMENQHDMKNFARILVVFTLFQVAMFLYGLPWLKDSIPGWDFAGAVRVVQELKDMIRTGDFSNWSMTRFCGSPNTILWTSLASLAYVPFTFGLDPILAVKVASLFYLGIAGFSLYVVCQTLYRNHFIALWAGLAYMISPIFLFRVVFAGHCGFAVFYAFLPWLGLQLWRMKQRPDLTRMIQTAMLFTLAYWIDLERAFMTLPFLCLLYVFPAFGSIHSSEKPVPSFRKSLIRLTGAVLVSVFLGMFLFGPLLETGQQMAFFSENILRDSRVQFAFPHPLELVNRFGWLSQQWAEYLPSQYSIGPGIYYMGISLILLLSGALWVRNSSDGRIRFLYSGLSILALAIWLASGPVSIMNHLTETATSLYQHLRFADDHPYLLTGIVLSLCLPVGLCLWLRRKWNYPTIPLSPLVLFLGGVIVVLYIPAFPAIGWLSPYSHLRNPGFFLSAIPPLLLVWGGASFLSYLQDRIRSSRMMLLIGGILGITILDYSPYRQGFSDHIPDTLTTEYRLAATALKTDARSGRYLSRESYSPLDDMLWVLTGRPSAWYWLNWSCPKETSKIFMGQIYPQLNKPESLDKALQLAGLFHVRFLTWNLLENPAPASATVLKSIYQGSCYAVYENPYCRDFVQTYTLEQNPSDSIDYEKLLATKPLSPTPSWKTSRQGRRISIEVDAPQTLLLVISQSLYPGWSAIIDSKSVPLSSIANTLPALWIQPGKHTVELAFHGSIIPVISLGISIATLIGCGTILTRQRQFLHSQGLR
jgi:hypothetical protein